MAGGGAIIYFIHLVVLAKRQRKDLAVFTKAIARPLSTTYDRGFTLSHFIAEGQAGKP